MPVDPTNLRIEVYPHEALRRKAEPIDPTPEVAAVAERMIDLMRRANGLGLAAPQVGLPWRLFVCEVPPGDDRSPDAVPPTASRGVEVFLNPEILRREGQPEASEEGCLSLPDIAGDVFRPPVVEMSAATLSGERITRTAGGLLARCWQHEIDHLDGVLILDRMTQMSRLKCRAAVRALERQAGIR